MKTREKIANILFYIAISLETILVLLDKSSYIIQHETWDFRLIFGIFALKIALTKYEKKEWLGIVAAVLLGTISWYISDREEIIRIAALIIACKNVDIKKALKLVLWETVLGTGVFIILSLLGVYGTISITTLFRGGGIEETRYCLGLGHPNALHCMVLMIILLILAVYEEKMKWWGYLIAFVANTAIYKFLTDSRTAILIGTAFIIFAVIFHYARPIRESKWAYILLDLLVAVEVAISFVAASRSVASSDFLWDLDTILNGRMDGVFKNGNIENWSLFSNVNNINIMDMGIAKAFYWYGIIPALIFFIIVMYCMWECRKKKEYGFLLILVTFLIYSLMEGHGVSLFIGRNYSFLVIGALLMERNNNGTRI